MDLLAWVAGFFSAIIGAMGMGGGGILLVYLTIVVGMKQINAQGINLAFFIPIAIISLFIHTKGKIVDWKTASICIVFGIIGVILGSFLAGYIGNTILKKIFGVFILLIGIKEVFITKKRKK